VPGVCVYCSVCVLQCDALCFIMLRSCIMLQSGVACVSGARVRIAVSCSVLQCVAVCCIMLHYVAVKSCMRAMCVSQCVAVCRSVSQCVAVCVKACCSVFAMCRGHESCLY